MADQIARLSLSPDEPLIICDCDEVLLLFIDGLSAFLEGEGFRLDLDSFRIHGNVKEAATGAIAPNETVSALLKGFYDRPSHDLAAAPGAAQTLDSLARRSQVVVLTNVSPEAKPMREANLAARGMTYPVIANHGLKGAAVAALAERVGRPVFFLDDIPHNLASVKAAVPECLCVHFIADPRLAGLLDQAPGSDYRARDWDDIGRFIAARLPGAGGA